MLLVGSEMLQNPDLDHGPQCNDRESFDRVPFLSHAADSFCFEWDDMEGNWGDMRGEVWLGFMIR